MTPRYPRSDLHRAQKVGHDTHPTGKAFVERRLKQLFGDGIRIREVTVHGVPMLEAWLDKLLLHRTTELDWVKLGNEAHWAAELTRQLVKQWAASA